MAPKKAVKISPAEDLPDVSIVPDGDDDRVIVVEAVMTQSARSRDPFVPQLQSAAVHLVSPSLETPGAESRSDAIPLVEEVVTTALFAKRININPLSIETFVGGTFQVQLSSVAETTAVPSVVPKGKKGAKKAVEPVEDTIADTITHLDFHFTLSRLLTSSTHHVWTFDAPNGNAVAGFESVEVRVKCNAPLLSPLNARRYPAVLIHVPAAAQLPVGGASKALHSQFAGVHVSYDFLHRTHSTKSLPHAPTITWDYDAVHFLGPSHLGALQELSEVPLVFTLHDRIPKDRPWEPAPCGRATLSLRTALDGVVSIAETLHVTPTRPAGVGHTPDYHAAGTCLHVKVRLTAPLPFVTFVPRRISEQGLSQSDAIQCHTATTTSFLTRIVLVLPYGDLVGGQVLRAVMGVVVQFPRPTGDSDVTEVPLPRPTTPLDTAPPSRKGAKGKTEEVTPVPEPPGNPIAVAHHPHGGDRRQLLVTVGDAVTGFEIMDGVSRLVVVEAPLPVALRIAEVAACVAGGSPNVKVLFNYELRCLKRRFLSWPPLVVPWTGTEAPPPEPAVEEIASSMKAKPDVKKDSKKERGSKKDKKKDKDKASRPGSGAPAVPAVPVSDPSQSLLVTGSSLGELDSGGVGGRLRRMRLVESLDKLRSEQRYFVRAALAPAALRCLGRLAQLRDAPSLEHAMVHDAFPDADELVALERCFGDCLETEDICGAAKFVPFSQICVDEVVADALREQCAKEVAPVRTEPTLAELLRDRKFGAVASFIAIPSWPDAVKKLPRLRHIAPRYSNKAYMHCVDEDQHYVCAFDRSVTAPTQLLRFTVTVQVVDAGDGQPVLFVMDCTSVALRGTDTRNPAFDAKKRQDKARLPHKVRVAQAGPLPQDSCDDSDDSEKPPVARKEMKHVVYEDDWHVRNTDDIRVKSERLAQTRTQAAQKLEKDYEGAWELHQRISAKEHDQQERWASLRAKGRHPFTTYRNPSALDSNQPSLKPTDARIQELRQPWQEGAPPLRSAGPRWTFKGGKELLVDRKPSVFAERLEDKVAASKARQRAAKESFAGKVAVDDVVFHVSLKDPARARSSTDKYCSLLENVPSARLRASYAPPAPLSIHTAEKSTALPRVERSASKHPEHRAVYYATPPRKPKRDLEPLSKSGSLWFQ